MGETSHDEANRPPRVEERTETEQPFSFKLAEFEFQSAGGRITQLVLRPPNYQIELRGLRAKLGAEAGRVVSDERADEQFNPRFFAKVREIELEPLGFPTHHVHSDIRLGHFDHRGIRWEIAFQINTAENTAFIMRVRQLGPVLIDQDT